MKEFYTVILLFLGLIVNAQQQEVRQSIETFFEGFHERDTVRMKSVCADKVVLQSISESLVKGNKLTEENSGKFYKSIATIPSNIKFSEKILSYNIQIEGTIAHVWAPYQFYVNDKLSHSGVNTFTLFKEKDTWKIIYLIDTRRK